MDLRPHKYNETAGICSLGETPTRSKDAPALADVFSFLFGRASPNWEVARLFWNKQVVPIYRPV